MSTIRRLLHRHRLFAAILLCLALAMKVAVPSGFMLGSANGGITVQICTGTGPMTVTMAIPGTGTGQHPDKPDHQGKEMPCAFAGLSAAAMAATDPFVLAMAVAFILAISLRITATCRARPRLYLRPPLRGPPPAS